MSVKTCPGCGERHDWNEAKVWGLLSIECPKAPAGYWYFAVPPAQTEKQA